MSRRALSLIALLLAASAVTACSTPTAPEPASKSICGGTFGGSGTC